MFEDRFNSPAVALHPVNSADIWTAMWSVLPADADEPCGELRFDARSRRCEIAIDVTHRRTGLATHALAACLPTLLQEGDVCATVGQDDPIAVALARRLGFERRADNEPWIVSSDEASRIVRKNWLHKFEQRAAEALRTVGLSPAYVRNRGLPLFVEARQLAPLPPDRYDRTPWLAPSAAAAWLEMRGAAAAEDVVIELISAFRSYGYQRALVKRKLAAGQSATDIFAVSAPPGYSEHHTGCAIDIGEPGQDPLTEAFEQSSAFGWLSTNAATFGFTLSYPRDNPLGMMYEPWHWRFDERG